MSTAEIQGAQPALEQQDLKTLLHLFQMNVHSVQVLGLPPGTPFLMSGWRGKRARKLVLCGLVKDHGGLAPAGPDMIAATITPAGVAAYNTAIAQAQGAAA